MRILYLTQRYIYGNGGYQYELLRGLNEEGIRVTVVASKFDGISEEFSNVEFVSAPINLPWNNSLVTKAFSQLLMPFAMKQKIKRYLVHENYDLVLSATPPITLGSVIKYCKKHFKCKAVLMLKDIFPQGAVDMKYFPKGGLLHRYYCKVEKKLYSLVNVIGTTSEGNTEYLLNHYPYIEPDKIISIPNAIRPRHTIEQHYRQENSISDEEVLCLFGGNLGRPQNVDLLIYAFSELRDKPIRFVVCGGGSEYHRIEEYIERSKNPHVTLIKYLPNDEYEKLLSAMDICLLTLTPQFTIPNTPDKMATYFAYGKPVVAATDRATDIGMILKNANAGLWSPSEEPDAFVENIKHLAENRRVREQMGEDARKYCADKLNVADVVETLVNIASNKEDE